VLRGYLRVRLLDRARSPIGRLGARTVSKFMTGQTARVRTVRLATGGKASFAIYYTDAPDAGHHACEPVSWLGIQLAGGRLDVPTKIAPCGGGFFQSPVQPGALPHPQHK